MKQMVSPHSCDRQIYIFKFFPNFGYFVFNSCMSGIVSNICWPELFVFYPTKQRKVCSVLVVLHDFCSSHALSCWMTSSFFRTSSKLELVILMYFGPYIHQMPCWYMLPVFLSVNLNILPLGVESLWKTAWQQVDTKVCMCGYVH